MAANFEVLALIIVKTNAQLAAQLEKWRADNQTIGFVPTMGALHRGHLHLIQQAKQQSGKVVCSIFVNPTQFNDPADFERYPRNDEADAQKLEQAGCDLLYLPPVSEVYDPAANITQKFDFGALETVMEGAARPGHFNGVGMVVKRLFELVKPDIAFFGLKDYQQYSIIRHMVAQYNMPIQVKGIDTVREPDGLAMSSRNVLLAPLHRELAPVIAQALHEARSQSETLPVNNLKLLVEQRLSQLPDVKVDYVEIAHAHTLQPLAEIRPGVPARIFVAAFFGKIRLIDNMPLNEAGNTSGL